VGKSNSSEGKPQKSREKVITRHHAEKALTAGADPNKFVKHPNYHVRRRAWQLMGRPLPEGAEEQNKFLATLQGMPAPKDAKDLPGYFQLIRQRILKEVPVKDVAVEAASLLSPAALVEAAREGAELGTSDEG
jgi:hypothetical protein